MMVSMSPSPHHGTTHMPGITNVADEFEAFSHSLREREGVLTSLAALNNGFEGWLKLEFFFWLIRHHRLDATAEDVGMEYKVALDRRFASMDRPTKQCDLWFRAADESRFHYIELKAPFANANQGKMLQSASDDYWYMSRLRGSTEQVASGSAILLGIGFSEENWTNHALAVQDYAGMPDDRTSARIDCLDDAEMVRWAVLTTDYQPLRMALA